MDVRCERCKTQYEIDDSRITETGVTVQCTKCHHVFVVKKKALVVTVPVTPKQEPARRPGTPVEPLATPEGPPPSLRPLSPPLSAPPPVTAGPSPEPAVPASPSSAQALPPAAAAAGAREWRLRQPSGNTFTFKDLTNLQKWIVERKVSRDDEISLTGETWKRLGDIAELATFFQVVDEAQRAVVLQAQLGMTPGAAAPPGGAPAAPLAATATAHKGSKLPIVLAVLLALLGVGALGYYYLVWPP